MEGEDFTGCMVSIGSEEQIAECLGEQEAFLEKVWRALVWDYNAK